MQDIFDITEKEIQELYDSDLRTLIGLLCEAELERNNLPVTAAKWGGNQRAADGGLDVYVDLENPTEKIGEIPRWKTGIQVKQEKMPRNKIIKEMCPKGIPRPVFTKLASNNGAYLIACGKESTSPPMRKDRLEAMHEACKTVPGIKNLKLDFFDSSNIKSWTHKHPSLVLWVKTKLGSNSSGWQPHDNWSECSDGIDGEFILDDSSKIYDDRSKDTDGLSAEDGLNRIRALLREERSCIRLAGLSGVGKTRFAQALYDERIGQNSLPKSIACYTDIAHSPSPIPRDMALQLIAQNKRAILIVDNCPPDLHDELSKVCTRADSKISLLTIEYDIRDDKPERTDVFRMEPSSNDLIEKLISNRFKDINNLEARRIAEFSEGNARIAIALAETFEKGDAILTLENNELFKRLFHQRNAEDDSLMRAAEVLSLVYSFEGETLGSPESELDRLAELAGMPAMELYRHVATLLKRGLAQKRSKWRAVLPHAIANRLAKQALENIPAQVITETLVKDESHRLLKSYTRRLGYLHDCEAAQGIVKSWLQPGGGLDDIATLGKRGIEFLKNVAPVAQEETLEAIERAAYGPEEDLFASRKNEHYVDITRLLRKLAYKPHLFKRSCLILLKFAATEKPNENYHSIEKLTSSLFQIIRSGTHASIDQRLEVLTECMEDNSPFASMTMPILNNLLKTRMFRSADSYEFGAIPRNYGYTPKTDEEIAEWYSKTFNLIEENIISNSKCSQEFRSALARNFSALWEYSRAKTKLEKLAFNISENSFWTEGWIAIRRQINAIQIDDKKDVSQQLLALEEALAPKNILAQAQVYALTERYILFRSIEQIKNMSLEEKDLYVNGVTTELAGKIVQNREALQKLIPNLISTRGNTFSFCQHLAVQCELPAKLWMQLVNSFSGTPKENRRTEGLQGFLEGMRHRDKDWYDQTLDNLIKSETLRLYFPQIQCSFHDDPKAAERLFKSLELNVGNVWHYERLWTLETDSLTFANLLSQLLETPEDAKVVLDILGMRFHHKQGCHLDHPIQVLGKNLCIKLCEAQLNSNDDYHMDEIIKKCFSYHSAKSKAKELCNKIIEETQKSIASAYHFESTIASLIQVQPKIVLNELLLNYKNGVRYFSWDTYDGKSAINLAPLSSVAEWCEIDPSARYPLVTQITPLFVENHDGRVESMSSVAMMLLDRSKDYPEILESITPHFYPTTGWSGELSIVAATRIPFFEQLKEHQHQCVRNWASEQLTELKKRIARQKIVEEKEAKARHESFE